jgi:hypothetical protein
MGGAVERGSGKVYSAGMGCLSDTTGQRRRGVVAMPMWLAGGRCGVERAILEEIYGNLTNRASMRHYVVHLAPRQPPMWLGGGAGAS